MPPAEAFQAAAELKAYLSTKGLDLHRRAADQDEDRTRVLLRAALAGSMSEGRGLAGLVPILGWSRTYQRGWLRGDLIAGVTVLALIVPKNLGYAGIAGIPRAERPLRGGRRGDPLRGLRHEPADLGRDRARDSPPSRRAPCSRRASPTRRTSRRSSPGSPSRPGVLFLLLAVLKMGWIAQFLSRAVVTGFLFGAAIDVVIGELPKLTGTKRPGSNPLQELWSWLGTLGDAHGDDRGGRRRLARRRLRPARRRAAGAGCARARGRRSARLVAVRSRRPRRRARRGRAARSADGRRCPTCS